MRKTLLFLLTFTLALGLGAWLMWQWQQDEQEHQRVEATILLERVREVCQLVTVEGTFSEVYNEKNIRDVTLYLPIPTQWSFSKQALLQVDAKVLVGYDMEQVRITVDSTAKRITLYNLPEPTILAIDHTLKYRDLQESYFNSFSPEDYTQLNANARAKIEEKALESDLLQRAQEQGNAMLKGIVFMANAIGWEVVYEEVSSNPPTTKPILD